MAFNLNQFAGGLSKGISQGIEDYNRYEVGQERRNKRQERETYKAALGELEGIQAGTDFTDAQERQAAGLGNDFMGPPPETDTGTVLQQVYQNSKAKVIDPQMRAELDKAFMGKVQQYMSPYLLDAQNALNSGMPDKAEKAAAALTEAVRFVSPEARSKMGYSFSVNDAGEVVNANGKKVGPEHMMAALQFGMQNPGQAMEILFGAGLKRDEAALNERKTTALEDRVGIDQSRAETASKAQAATEAYYKRLSEHYERADATDLLGELNDLAAAGGAGGLEPADVKRVNDMVDAAMVSGTNQTLISKDPTQIAGVAKQIAILNGAAQGKISADDAVRLSTELYYHLNEATLSDDEKEMLTEQYGPEFFDQGDIVLRPIKDRNGVRIDMPNGENFVIPTPYVQPYIDKQQAAEQQRNAAEASRAAIAYDKSINPPEPVTQASTAGSRRRPQAKGGGVTISGAIENLIGDVPKEGRRGRNKPRQALQ